jgi:predicted Zn-dependent peptidase
MSLHKNKEEYDSNYYIEIWKGGMLIMSNIQETIVPMNGYNLHLVNTTKYKTTYLLWRMRSELKEETVTLRSLLPQVLQNNSASYPTTMELRSHLEELYGAGFYVDLAKKGNSHIISFAVDVANEKYLSSDNRLLNEGLTFLNEILFNPNVENKSFQADTVKKEKRGLKQRIASLYDDKMRFASNRMLEEMFEEDDYRFQSNGLASKVDEITEKSLFEYYLKAFAEDELDLYIIGDVSKEQAIELCKEKFQLSQRPELQKTKVFAINASKPEIVKETQEIKQGKLVIGYLTGTRFGEEDYYALQLYNGLFGGFSHSKLFMNVREKASLAYYAGSGLESHKGLLIVSAGIDTKNFDQALKIIREQEKAMKNGEFTDTELEQTKSMLINQLLETYDTASGMAELMYHNVLAEINISVEEWIEKINQVKNKDVKAIAQKISENTVYFLSGGEDNQ